MERLISTAQVKPANNQVEVSLNLNQKALIKFCKEHNIAVTGYSPFGNPGNSRGLDNLWNTTVIQELSCKYNKTPAQVTLRFILQMGSAIISKSVTKSRIKENIEIFDFNLTLSETSKIQALETGNRLITYESARNDKFYPFNIPY
ncbi:1,5-anhydro-D-fructose reductase [Nasonia vitripennis]|uniref:NADP-dependent oxidoreductase domain-containing protein n=1 Tax=Nasonia vitripennis TaxID=7425 RepID=A0A7M7QQW7_NASVI|nr:1,5-anhydro-D-fructose reductase [Nasonia vitripennis]